MAASMKKPSVSFTLPIACQICLGKVKEPVVCSNQHVFCNTCMEVWLQHQSHCPTCRIPITTESPCKQILGGPSFNEDSQKRRSNPELRKMRFEMLHREYEAEIETLQTEVDRLSARNSQLEKLKSLEEAHPSKSAAQSSSHPISASESIDLKRSQDDTTTREGSSSHSHQENFTLDNFMLLTQKLKKISNAYQKLKAEMERVKQDNTQLRDINAGYLREIGRLKQTITCRSPRKYEKYAQAAQQAKLDKSEQEVKQLKRALERSDVYVEELECKLERYEQAHGPLEPRSNHSLTLNVDGCLDEGSRDSVKTGELDITYVPDSPDVGDDPVKVHSFKMENDEPAAKKFYSNNHSLTLHGCLDEGSRDSVKTGELDITIVPDSPDGEGDHATVHLFKMENNEPAAKKFYSNKGVSLLDSPSTSAVSRGISLSPDQTLHSKFPGSSKSGSGRADDTLSDGRDEPSTNCVSSITPSSKFSNLRLSSDIKVNRARNESIDSVAIAADRGTCSQWTSLKKSPRRQLQFDSKTHELSTDHRKVSHSVPATAATAAAFAENSNSADNRDTLGCKGRSPEKRKLNETQNDTLNELDYTLTEEFVDCAKLLKAAEKRIRQKSGRNSDAGSSLGSSSSGSGS